MKFDIILSPMPFYSRDLEAFSSPHRKSVSAQLTKMKNLLVSHLLKAETTKPSKNEFLLSLWRSVIQNLPYSIFYWGCKRKNLNLYMWHIYFSHDNDRVKRFWCLLKKRKVLVFNLPPTVMNRHYRKLLPSAFRVCVPYFSRWFLLILSSAIHGKQAHPLN